MNLFPLTIVLITAVFSGHILCAQENTQTRLAPNSKVLNDTQWTELDDSVQRGLQWLAAQQQQDGSFESLDLGQPAISSFCLMAFLAQGESPNGGKYQQQLTKAVDYIIAQQKANGLIAVMAPDAAPISRRQNVPIAITAVYNHAISALALCETYGQCSPQQSKSLVPVIEKAIAATIEMQQWNDKPERDVGGWRYLGRASSKPDSDLSVTGWQLMFLRSAQNAGFNVPKDSIDGAVTFIENCFLTQGDRQVHAYLVDEQFACTRAMAGAGVLAMAHAGRHESKEAIASGEWILKHDFNDYNAQEPIYGYKWLPDRYHYGAILCTQAMYQLGGKYWEQFFPPLVEILLANQRADGSWPPEKAEPQYGNCYTTSLCVLSLSVPNQILPIFQR